MHLTTIWEQSSCRIRNQSHIGLQNWMEHKRTTPPWKKELLSILMVLKNFRTMLLGSEIHIHTDHKNLTFANLNTQRVLRWRCYLEEYSPTMHYIKGQNNVIADAFSWLDWINDSQCLEGKNAPFEMPRELEQGCDIVQDAQMLEFFLNVPPLNDHGDNPLNYKY